MTDNQFQMFTVEAGEASAIATHEAYLTVLSAIASRSTRTLGAVRQDIPELPKRDEIVRNLLDRKVIEEDTPSTLRIRVGLFRDWLRANPVAAWAMP
jgi:hypothetical protein